jgi:hypothetical protein
MRQRFRDHREKYVRTKLAALAGAIAIAVTAAACSSTPATKSGTETITGTESGQPAANNLNSNSNAAPTFQVFTYTGPVSTTVKNYTLPGGNNNAKTMTNTFVTSAGNLTITHTRTYQPGNNVAPSVTAKSGDVCTFTLVAEKGTYVTVPSKSTGQFKDATGHGTYVITLHIGAKLPAGKTTCSIADYGNNGPTAIAQGSSFVFKATGPLTVSS